LSFSGVGVFDKNGKLHNTAFSCIKGNGERFLFTNMEEGRPGQNSYMTWFNDDDRYGYDTSKNAMSDFSGW
jgi:hypothetical protein